MHAKQSTITPVHCDCKIMFKRLCSSQHSHHGNHVGTLGGDMVHERVPQEIALKEE